MIRKSILDQIRTSKKCKAELQLALDKAAPTIQRYLDDNDIMLTTAAALAVISKYTDTPESDILERSENTA